MLEHIVIHGQPTFIVCFEVNDDVCDEILKVYDTLDPHPGFVSDQKIKKEEKYSYDVNILPNYSLHKYQTILEEKMVEYSKMFDFDYLFDTPKGITETLNIQKFPANGGGFHKRHCERGARGHTYHRELVYMTYLNDIDEGGETYFDSFDLKVKPKKGLSLIWPAGWTHSHKGLPCTQDKYIITGWFSNFY